MYKKIPINGQHEVIGMSGDIALYQGKPVVHTHMLVGGQTEQRAAVMFSRHTYHRR
jgi:predicted DNA-binding protein with PD1-like motif